MKRASRISSRKAVLVQRDTFFNTPRGRLKLRRLGGGKAQLIYYERTDKAGPKTSRFEVAPVRNPALVTKLLAAALGRKAEVRKRRTVFFHGQTRIHFDEVEGLGRFIELEVVLRPGQGGAEGNKIARRIMKELDIQPPSLIKGAYADLPRHAQ
jgi:adenylate cyclase class IV